jgi:hypothetical protein
VPEPADPALRIRAAAAGAAAAAVWAAVEPLDRRLFRCDYSDVALVGLPLHLVNGALFGLAWDELRRRGIRVPAAAAAIAEHTALWPLLALRRPDVVRSPRAFAQGVARHALFGAVLGRLAPPAP